MALIEAAERDGRLRPGGTIVEPTSGNTGTGLAIAARLKGYRVMAVMPDKMSREKIDLLRAYGAEVVLAPTDVPPDSPQLLLPRRRPADGGDPGRLPAQPVRQPGQPPGPLRVDRARRSGSRPRGRITHLVVGVGTGGTVTGTARYLRERSPDLVVVGADPEGSIYSGGEENVRPYLVEGVGEDFWPADLRPRVGRPLGHGVRPRRVPHHAPACPDRGDPRRRLRRARRCTPR